MKTIQVMTAVLIVLNALFGTYYAFLYRKLYESSIDSKEITRKHDSKNQESFYRNYNEITSIIACLLLSVIAVALIWKGYSFRFIPKPLLQIALVLSIVASIYYQTESFESFATVRKVFFLDNDRSVKTKDLLIVVIIIAVLYNALYWGETTSNGVVAQHENWQLGLLVSIMFKMFAFTLVSSITVINCAICFKEWRIASKLKKLSRSWEKLRYTILPSLIYIRRKKNNQNKHILLLFGPVDVLMKCIYILTSTLLGAFVALYKIIINTCSTAGKVLGIKIINAFDIGKPRAYRGLLGWCLIVALTMTYTYIVFLNDITDRIVNLYSFIAGIIIIPVVISSIFANRR